MEKVQQINIGGLSVGLIDVDKILEEVKSFGINDDERLKKELLHRVKQKNYVPESREEEYKRALLREYKKFIGEEIPEEEEGLRMKVLGPGCPNCERLTQEVMAALTELGVAADFEHVREPARIGKYGVMGTPALVINNKVKSVGRVPSRNQIKQWIEAEVKGE